MHSAIHRLTGGGLQPCHEGMRSIQLMVSMSGAVPALRQEPADDDGAIVATPLAQEGRRGYEERCRELRFPLR